LLFAFLAAFYLYREFPEASIAVMATLVVGVIGALLAVPVLHWLRSRYGEVAANRWVLVDKLLQLVDAEDTKETAGNLRHSLAAVAGLSALILAIQTGIMVVLAEALGLGVSLPFLIMSWSLVTLAVTLPLTIGGLGLREGVLVAMFVAVGEPKEDALALGLLFFVIVMISRLPGSIPWFRSTAASSARRASETLAVDASVSADAPERGTVPT
jgi:uncharacterized membrane protein YbhN (UPF0104 family)